jgi:hypothetical protein
MWKIFSVPCGSTLYKFHCVYIYILWLWKGCWDFEGFTHFLQKFISLCLSMYVHLTSMKTIGQIFFIFGNDQFIHHTAVPSECGHFSSKNRDESRDTKWLFSQERLLRLWMCFNDFWRSSPKIKLHRWCIPENNSVCTSGPGLKYNFYQSGFLIWTDFIVIQNLATVLH